MDLGEQIPRKRRSESGWRKTWVIKVAFLGPPVQYHDFGSNHFRTSPNQKGNELLKGLMIRRGGLDGDGVDGWHG